MAVDECVEAAIFNNKWTIVKRSLEQFQLEDNVEKNADHMSVIDKAYHAGLFQDNTSGTRQMYQNKDKWLSNDKIESERSPAAIYRNEYNNALNPPVNVQNQPQMSEEALRKRHENLKVSIQEKEDISKMEMSASKKQAGRNSNRDTVRKTSIADSKAMDRADEKLNSKSLEPRNSKTGIAGYDGSQGHNDAGIYSGYQMHHRKNSSNMESQSQKSISKPVKYVFDNDVPQVFGVHESTKVGSLTKNIEKIRKIEKRKRRTNSKNNQFLKDVECKYPPGVIDSDQLVFGFNKN